MRVVVVIPGFVLLLVAIFFIGVTRGTPDPETLYPSPKNVEEFLSRGRLYEKHKKYEQALADYTQAAKLAPSNSSAYLGQAAALSALNRHAEAIAKYQIVRQLDQQNGFSTRMTDLLIESEQKNLQKRQ
jgi:tetratricopeptide (TPR) repeat protein